ncbi:LssY C-terminal domain-containing protein, partial [Cellulomonas iranensis]
MSRSHMRAAVFLLATMLAAYLAVSYFLVPELWVFHDSRRRAPLNPMVTSTEQGIPGDPINVGLV